MKDLIERNAAIAAFLTELTKRERKNLLHTWSTVEVKYFVVDMLEKSPSAQPERKWIPCSERLPDSVGWDKSYLVSLAWGGVGVMEYKSTGWHNYGYFSPVPIEAVTAWMPLPEPYKEVDKDE